MPKITPTRRVLFPRRFIPVLLVLLAVGSFLLVNLQTSPKAQAATSSYLNFQARLESATGAVAADGNYNVEFNIYSGTSCNPATGASCSVVWTEDWLNNASQGIHTSNGYLTASLGSHTAFPNTINWDQQLYISMTVRGTGSCTFATCTPADSPMLPYLQLTSVPYAFKAGQLAQANAGATLFSSLSIQAPTVGNQTFVIQDQAAAGTYNILTALSGTDGYVKLQATSGSTQTGYLNISGTALAGNLQVAAGGTIDTASAGILNIGTGNASTLNIGSNAGAHTINIGTGAAVQTITLGSLNSTSASTIQSGSGGINLFADGGTNSTTGISVKSANNNSTKAFQILNSSGTSLLTADTSNTQLTVNAQTTLTATTNSFPSTSVLDNFNRANGGLGANWTGPLAGDPNQFTINTNQITTTSTTDNGSAWSTPFSSPNLEAYVKVSTPAATWQAVDIANSPTSGTFNGYTVIAFASGDVFRIDRIDSGVATTLKSTTQHISAGDSIGLSKIGNQVSAWYKSAAGSWTLLATATDTTYNVSGFYIGAEANDTSASGTVRLDDFGGGVSSIAAGLTVNGTQLVQTLTNTAQAFQVQNAAGSNVLAIDTSAGQAILGTPSSLGGSLKFYSASGTGSISLNLSNGASAGNYNLTIPSISANDTICLQTAANCGGGGSITLGTYSATNVDAHGATLSAGVLTFQDASASAPGMVSSNSQTFGGNKTFNGNVILSSTSTINFTGNTTANRPAGTDGQLYYDTSTHQLLQYSSGLTKWVSDRTNAIIVAANNSTQAEKDAADYVATGTGDQAAINSALSDADPAGSGKKVGQVLLLGGTYNLSAAVSVPNNTTLAGVGDASLITIPNAQNGNYSMIQNTDQTTGTNVTVRDLRIDGNKANQTGGAMFGVTFINMGSGSTRAGGRIINVSVNNLYSVSTGTGTCTSTTIGAGICVSSSAGSTISNTRTLTNANQGIYLTGSTNNTITGNTAQGNTNYGIYLFSSSNNNTVTGNTEGGSSRGIRLFGSTNNTITGNTALGNSTYGIEVTSSSNNTAQGNTSSNIYLSGSTNNTITGNNTQGSGGFGIELDSTSNNNTVGSNKIYDSSGSTANNGIFLQTSSYNTITDNDITDTACTTTCYAINVSDSGSNKNYLSNNHYSGSAANTASINDSGTNTVYANQQTNATNSTNSDVSDFMIRGSANSATALQIQNASGSNVLGVDTSAGQAFLGKASTLSGSIKFYSSTGTGSISLNLSNGASAGNYNLTIPSISANDTICLQTAANCGGSISLGTYSTTNTDAHGATLSAGVLTFQDASGSAPGMVGTGTQTFAGAKTFSSIITGSAGITTSGGAFTIQGNAASSLSTVAVAGGSTTITIQTGNASAGTAGAITIDNGTSSTGTSQLNLGNTNARSIVIGSTTSTTTTAISGGVNGTTPTVSIQAAASGYIAIATTNANTVQIGAVGSTANATTVHIADTSGAATQSITIGSTSSASGTTLQSGTTGISLLTNGGASATVGTLVKSLTNNSSGAFQVQNSSGNQVFTVDTTATQVVFGKSASVGASLLMYGSTSGSVTIATSASAITSYTITLPTAAPTVSGQCLQATTAGVASWGTCGGGGGGHTKSIVVPAEYAGAVLDASSDSSCSSTSNGTMTSGYSGDSSPRQNFYQWISGAASTNCYDIVVQIQVPSDWASWSSAPTLYVYNSAGTNSTSVYVEAIGTNNTVDSNYAGYVAVSSSNTALTSATLTSLDGTNYTAGGYMTLKIRVSSPNTTTSARVGNITLNYNSSY